MEHERAGQTIMVARIFATVTVLSLSGTGEAAAHAFPRPYDLPLPLGHWLIGAGAAVAVSFLAAVGLVRKQGRARERLRASAAGRPNCFSSRCAGSSSRPLSC